MSEVAQFHSLAHIFISFIGAILLLAIWYNIRKRFRQTLEEEDNQKRVDKGLLYLSLAMFVWVVSGTWAYLSGTFAFSYIINSLGISLFSILNNLFILLALFYFYHAPPFIYNNEKNITKVIFAIVGTAVLTIVLNLIFKENFNGVKESAIPDLILSGFLSYLMMVSFYKTFMNRDLKIVAYISVFAIGLMFLSQLSEVFTFLQDDFYNNLIKIIAKTSLIAIFLVLATSWVIQLAHTTKPSEMMIQFMDWGLVKLTIPSKGIYEQVIDFGSKATQYKNLLKFAARRKLQQGEGQYLLVSSTGEIKSQTYLTRIIDNINSILQLESEQKLERRDLFTFIGQAKYRLRILPENIHIEPTLLHEFNNK